MKTLFIDLDGVLNTYTGDFDENYIPPMRDGAKEFLEQLRTEYKIKIFTTRDKERAEKWVEENGLTDLVEGVTNYKEPCYLIIDDRCVRFGGDYQNTLAEIQAYKPWYRVKR